MEERRRTYRALVVEDDEPILNLVKIVLERESFTVEGVRTAAHAIELLETVAYDLLILDMKLTVDSGERVLEYLEDAQPVTLRGVIVTTASPRQISCQFLERICRILAKPFDIVELALFARQCVSDEPAA